MQVKTLLEESGLPYAVTPGAEDCIEAFELIFGLEPSAHILRSRAGKRNRSSLVCPFLVAQPHCPSRGMLEAHTTLLRDVVTVA